MQMHTSTKNNDVNMDKEFQQHPSKNHLKNGVIDQEKYRKTASERKWTDIDYHIQNNSDVEQKYVKIYYNKKKLPELIVCGPHYKHHGAR